MTSIDLGKDLNATISAAVNAKVTAEVFAALNNDAIFGQFITQALMEPIKEDRYSSKTEPYLSIVLRKAVQTAVKEAIGEWMADNSGAVKSKVREALSGQVEEMAGALVASATEAMSSHYMTKVDVKFQKDRD